MWILSWLQQIKLAMIWRTVPPSECNIEKNSHTFQCNPEWQKANEYLCPPAASIYIYLSHIHHILENKVRVRVANNFIFSKHTSFHVIFISFQVVFDLRSSSFIRPTRKIVRNKRKSHIASIRTLTEHECEKKKKSQQQKIQKCRRKFDRREKIHACVYVYICIYIYNGILQINENLKIAP